MSIYYDWKKNIDNIELSQCGKIVRDGGIVVFPTETVYAIGANALNESAVAKVFEVKKRPLNKAINILIANKREIEKYAVINNEKERRIINKFMPGPLTIILEKKENLSNIVTAGNNTIGIRIPDNEIALEILKSSKVPIAAPSANISGEESGIYFQKIKNDFDGKVDVLVDGGKSKICESSTIVQIINNEIVIHRQGAITKNELEGV